MTISLSLSLSPPVYLLLHFEVGFSNRVGAFLANYSWGLTWVLLRGSSRWSIMKISSKMPWWNWPQWEWGYFMYMVRLIELFFGSIFVILSRWKLRGFIYWFANGNLRSDDWWGFLSIYRRNLTSIFREDSFF